MLDLEIQSDDSLDLLYNFTQVIEPAIKEVYGTPVEEDDGNCSWKNDTNTVYATMPKKDEGVLRIQIVNTALYDTFRNDTQDDTDKRIAGYKNDLLLKTVT